MRHTEIADQFVIEINLGMQVFELLEDEDLIYDDSFNNIIFFLKKNIDNLSKLNIDAFKVEFWELVNDTSTAGKLKKIYEVKFNNLLMFNEGLKVNFKDLTKLCETKIVPLINRHNRKYKIITTEELTKIIYLFLQLVTILDFLRSEIISLLDQCDVYTGVSDLKQEQVVVKSKNYLNFKLASYKKADFIRMITDMYDNDTFVPVDPSLTLTKENIINAFGTFLNEDLSSAFEDEKPVTQTKKEKPAKKNNDDGKTFPDYLLHEKKIKLAEAIKKEFSTEKGKAIRILLGAMEVYDPPLISIGSRQTKEIYMSLASFMNRDIGSYQSVIDYPFDEETDKVDINNVTVRLNHLLKMIEKDKTA